jgi:hypothetical protein
MVKELENEVEPDLRQDQSNVASPALMAVVAGQFARASITDVKTALFAAASLFLLPRF